MIQYLAAAGTDSGLVAARNQDSFGAKVFNSRYGPLTAAIMCDGMGGYSCGEVASSAGCCAACRCLRISRTRIRMRFLRSGPA